MVYVPITIRRVCMCTLNDLQCAIIKHENKEPSIRDGIHKRWAWKLTSMRYREAVILGINKHRLNSGETPSDIHIKGMV